MVSSLSVTRLLPVAGAALAFAAGSGPVTQDHTSEPSARFTDSTLRVMDMAAKTRLPSAETVIARGNSPPPGGGVLAADHSNAPVATSRPLRVY